MSNRTVVVYDLMQTKYTYVCTEPVGKNFDPEFRPDITPQEMLALGVFGGVYMRDCTNEFPKSWFVNAQFAPKEIKKHVKEINYFGVNASMPLSYWKEKGWIHKDDPRGWFQWYCRYYMGRRSPLEDARQIGRWKAMRRHVGQVINKCIPGDYTCNTKQRQALLHWAYDSRKM